MKRSDTLLSASRSLQAEVGVTEFSAVPAYNPRELQRNFVAQIEQKPANWLEDLAEQKRPHLAFFLLIYVISRKHCDRNQVANHQ